MDEPQRTQEITGIASKITPGIARFVEELTKEGERSAVILGAARLDVALERLLKRLFRYEAGGSDNLFDPDRPLGSFSAKIALAYRIGAISKEVEHGLQMIRKIRNDFAHATTKASLTESQHQGRLHELSEAVDGLVETSALRAQVTEALNHAELAQFCVAVTGLIVVLEIASELNGPLSVKHEAGKKKAV